MDLTKDAAVGFNPKDPRWRHRLWVRVESQSGPQLIVFWRRIGLVLAVLAFVGWLAAAAAVWSWVRVKRGFHEARYTDIVLPWQWAQHRAAMGRSFLAQGQAALAEKRIRDAIFLLQAGLARVPTDLPARRSLAYTYVRIGRPDLALRILRDGVAYAGQDLDYLRLLFSLLLEAHEDEQVIDQATKLLPTTPDQQLRHQFVALQSATAHFQRGRYDQAEDLIAAWGLERALEGQILLARADWERGLRDAALLRLQQQLGDFGQRDELHLELIRFYRALKRPSDARRHALLRYFNQPDMPGPRADLIRAHHDAGESAEERREIERFLTEFRGDATALVLLAWQAVDLGDPGLVKRVRGLARNQGIEADPFELALVQALITARRYTEALTESDRLLEAARAGVGAGLPPFLAGLRAVAFAGAGESERSSAALNTFLNEARMSRTDAAYLVARFKELDAHASSRRVLEHAIKIDPLNESARIALLENVADDPTPAILEAHLPALLGSRKPPRLLLARLFAAWPHGTDPELRARVAEALAALPVVD